MQICHPHLMTPGENLHEAVRSWSMDGSACHPRSCNTLEALSLNQSSDELFSHGNGSTALESFPLRMGYNARHHFLQKCRMIRRRVDGLVTGLVIICAWIAPICSVYVERITLQTQNSPDLTPKFRSLRIKSPGKQVIGNAV